MNTQDLLNEKATAALNLMEAEEVLEAAKLNRDRWQKKYDTAEAGLALMKQLEQKDLLAQPEQGAEQTPAKEIKED